MFKSDFFYQLPERLIAQRPLKNRTASRLLCLKSNPYRISDYLFHDLTEMLDPGDLLVFNDTRVIPARLYGNKETGGRVEILIERILDESGAAAHIRASKSPKPGSRIQLDGGANCIVTGRSGDLYLLQFEGEASIELILQQSGHIPLPPYIDRPDDQHDIDRYQTIYARRDGAVAAPTAGLHFDITMLQALEARGIESAYITLHVGSGTFQPVRTENLLNHKMHSEYYEVSDQAVAQIQATRQRGGRVIAVGTTAVRALESAARSGELKAFKGETELFILPGFQFHCVDAMVTNFHLPESTLLTLTCAFAGYDEVMDAYRYAVVHDYRFFSYGDAMYISRKTA